MKRNIIIMALGLSSLAFITSCSKDSFADFYRNPSKIEKASVDKQYTGVMFGFKELIIPTYTNIFVTQRPTINRYIQTMGWVDEANHLTVGAAATEARWTQYYKGLAQFKDLERLYNELLDVEKEEKLVLYLTAKILFYDQTQQMVDLFGPIPWSAAGTLNANPSDFKASYAKYDSAEEIYESMLDDLKSISEQLKTLTTPTSISTVFATQDLVHKGDLALWRKYANGLRLRMLTRVSESSKFASRATTELATIINDRAGYPLPLVNAENAQINIFDSGSKISSDGIRDAFEAGGTWYANLSSKRMIDPMVANNDPRLPFIFEPGVEAKGKFHGLDQSIGSTQQSDVARGGTIAIYNRSTFSRSKFFPGILLTSSEVNFLLAEYYNKNGKSAEAKTTFENGIKESVALFEDIRSRSDDNVTPAASKPTSAQIDTYISNLKWDAAANKIELIAYQKWTHFNIVQAVEAWAEVRRLDYPKFTVTTQSSDLNKNIPMRFTLPSSETTYNKEHYAAVHEQNNQNNKLFWDVK